MNNSWAGLKTINNQFNEITSHYPNIVLYFTNIDESRFQLQSGHDSAWCDCTMDEMRAYLGLLIIMGINKLPDYRLHWSKNKFLSNSGFIGVMPVRRYEKTTQYLHCSCADADDPLWKIRPILGDYIREHLKCYKPRQHQTIDEGMIAYKGRHKVVHYAWCRMVTDYSRFFRRFQTISVSLRTIRVSKHDGMKKMDFSQTKKP
jgi:hypothetical protein